MTRIPSIGSLLATTALAAVVSACAGATREAPPGTRPVPGADATPRPPSDAELAEGGYTAADVRFMQHMIAHHAQALVMTALVPERTTTPEIRLAAERIARSQEDEIATMRRWLLARGEEAPSGEPHELMHHGAGGAHADMPGMLGPDELARLREASGAEFDRLFLEYMIRHHEGALVMVGELFATPGAAQESEVFNLASEVDADQRAEIRRMQALQESLGSASRPASPRD